MPSVEQKETRDARTRHAAHYRPVTQEEATSLLRDVMLPKARELQGFKGALILNDAVMNAGIIITLWETEADLEASQPPHAIMGAIERLGLLLSKRHKGSTRLWCKCSAVDTLLEQRVLSWCVYSNQQEPGSSSLPGSSPLG